MRALTALLLLASVAIGVGLWSSFATPNPVGDTGITPATGRLPPAPASAARDDGQRRRDEVAMILARPLFSATRRPRQDPDAPAQAAAAATALPRMTAILINGKLRSAIFDGNGKPTILGEGGHLGPFTIQRIEAQQVTVIGPEGKRVVRTSFSNDPPPPPTLPQAMLPGPQLGTQSGTQAPPPFGVILPPGTPNLVPGFPNLGPSR
jgi:hypothetical protein